MNLIIDMFMMMLESWEWLIQGPILIIVSSTLHWVNLII